MDEERDEAIEPWTDGLIHAEHFLKLKPDRQIAYLYYLVRRFESRLEAD